jgi:hypothetical protein
VFLNNRYYDPQLARFISVDPLGKPDNPQSLNPYTYSLNNPTTYSDPTGLYSCVDGCGSEADQLTRAQSRLGGKSFSSVSVPIRKREGAGVIKVDFFIAASEAGIPGAHDEGNDRGFDIDAPYWESKVQVSLDLENGVAIAHAAPTCDANGEGCHDARGWQIMNSPDDKINKELNQLLIQEDDDQIRVQIRGLNSRRSDKGALKIPSIDDVFLFTLDGSGLRTRRKGDSFPSTQVSWSNPSTGQGIEVYRSSEHLSWIMRAPLLDEQSWGSLKGKLNVG